MKSANVIRFQAQVSQVKTMADGGIRLVLDLPESAIDTATKMMQVRQSGSYLEVAAVPVKKEAKSDGFEFGFDMSQAFPDLQIERVK